MGDDEPQLHLDACDGPAVIGIWRGYLRRGLSQLGCNEGLNSVSVGLIANNKVVVLSLGTTRGKKVLSTPKNNLGWLDWFEADLIDMILDAASKSAVDYKMLNYLGPRYHPMDTVLEEPIDLDDISSIQRLVGLANEFDMDAVELWIEGFWL